MYGRENRPAIPVIVMLLLSTAVSGQWVDAGSVVRLQTSSDRVAIGSLNADVKLHVYAASAGSVTAHYRSIAAFEHNTHAYLSILTPNNTERGILFGDPESYVNGGIIYNSPSIPDGFNFRTNGNSTKMTLTAGGHLGIGTTSPDVKLHVLEETVFTEAQLLVEHSDATGHSAMRLETGDGWVNLEYDDEGDDFQIVVNTYEGDTPRAFFFTEDGDLGIGVSPAHPLHIRSGAYSSAGGVWTNASSRALKENIQPLSMDEAHQALAGLTPVTYNYLADRAESHVGFIAEDVPDLVATNERTGLASMDIVAVLTRVVQDQQRVIGDLSARLSRLESGAAAVKRGTDTALTTQIIGEPPEEPADQLGYQNPTSLELAQNFPNPFNPMTTIEFALPEAGMVSIDIYNSLGQHIRKLLGGKYAAGYHSVRWDGTGAYGNQLTSGIYLYRLTAGGFTRTRKMSLLR